MGLTCWQKASGAWATRGLWHKEAGAWLDKSSLKQVYRKISGAWVPLFPPQVTVSAVTLSDFSVEPTNSTAKFIFQTSGSIAKYDPLLSSGQWVADPSSPAFSASLYEIYVAQNAGSPDPVSSLTYNDGIGSWLTLSSAREWGLLETGVGGAEVWLDVTVREIAKPSNTATGLYKLSVWVEGSA
jgi:hypothetical protein